MDLLDAGGCKQVMQRRLCRRVNYTNVAQSGALDGPFDRLQALVGDFKANDIGIGMLARQMQQERAVTKADFHN